MQPLYHELSVLNKAVHFKNLSAAALHVGLSQPQLSRIIAKIEDELKVVLLDRSAKRKSGWTPVAFQLAEIFEKSNKRLEGEILSASNLQMVSELHVGTLEGLASSAMKTVHGCFESIGIQRISLDVLDLSELEANFLSGDLDLIFTSKTPGRQKFRHIEELGYQDMTAVKSNRKFGLFSTFEYNRLAKKNHERFPHVLVSNSLAVKKDWFEAFGGTGTLPTEPRKGKTKDHEQVLLIGSELLSPVLWEKIRSVVDVS
ncbi:MAG: LysR family transcriptional regulator [Bdellovibrionaceae bacterium]|nr:LysR family transcriptional regulator [Pseudobdellovibrionaceae bacterium]MBX3032698.1 LysR family transcriptional regulator [Pseudobdellovibrionaceae bacterium]